MVEREVLQSPEIKVRVLEQASFEEMGIDIPDDKLNLGADKLTLAVAEGSTPNSRVNIVFDHHPFSGEHTAQLLNRTAPFGFGGRREILGDLTLPVNAKRAIKQGKTIEESEALRLHKRHLQDYNVGPLYESFIDQHLNSWLRSLRNSASSDVFNVLRCGKSVKKIEDFTSYLFAEWNNNLSKDEDYIKILYSATNTLMHYYRYGDSFRKYFMTQINLKEGELFIDRFNDEPLTERKRFMSEFLEQLTKDEKEEVAIAYGVNQGGQMLIDLNSGKIWKGNHYNGSANFCFADGESAEIKDEEGTSILLALNNEVDDGLFNWKAIRYTFSPKYLSTALYPTITWETSENGERRFLNQDEAKPYLKQLGIPEARKGDVKLGENMAASFSPNITGAWKRQMPLDPLEGVPNRSINQPMMGGQMGVWVALYDHSE